MCLCNLLTIWTGNHEICMLKSKLQVLHKPGMLHHNANTRCLCFCWPCCDDSSGRLYMNRITKSHPCLVVKCSVFISANNDLRGDMCIVCVEQMVLKWEAKKSVRCNMINLFRNQTTSCTIKDKHTGEVR